MRPSDWVIFGISRILPFGVSAFLEFLRTVSFIRLRLVSPYCAGSRVVVRTVENEGTGLLVGPPLENRPRYRPGARSIGRWGRPLCDTEACDEKWQEASG